MTFYFLPFQTAQHPAAVLHGRLPCGFFELMGEVGMGGKAAGGRQVGQSTAIGLQGRAGGGNAAVLHIFVGSFAEKCGENTVEMGRRETGPLRQKFQCQGAGQVIADIFIRINEDGTVAAADQVRRSGFRLGGPEHRGQKSCHRTLQKQTGLHGFRIREFHQFLKQFCHRPDAGKQTGIRQLPQKGQQRLVLCQNVDIVTPHGQTAVAQVAGFGADEKPPFQGIFHPIQEGGAGAIGGDQFQFIANNAPLLGVGALDIEGTAIKNAVLADTKTGALHKTTSLQK